MYTLQVIVDKLNIRNAPQPDPTFANWVGDLAKGTFVNCDRLIQGGMLENNNNWYADGSDNYYWAGGVKDISGTAAAADPTSVYPWWITANGIDTIWQRTKGNGVKVAILDTGINAGHPALSKSIKKIVYSAYKQGASPADSQGTVDDKIGHGTECAGMVTAFDDAIKANCCGVAPEAELYIYKVFNDQAGDFNDFMVTGLIDAMADEVDIISISRSYDISPAVQAQIQKAITSKIFIIVSGGNSSEGQNPLMAVNGIIKVGAVNDGGNDIWQNVSINAESPATLSCYAPGIDITTTSKEGEFVTDSGCSFATPLIAGLFALKLALTDRSNANFYNKVMNDFNAAVKPNSSRFKIPIIQNFIK